MEFRNRGERTEMVLMHSRFATVASRDNHIVGWSGILDSFAALLEKE